MVFIIYMLYLIQMVTRNWMYNADRHSEEFINGMHYFLRVAEKNKRDDFMCCLCAVCKNLMEYSNSRTLLSHLLTQEPFIVNKDPSILLKMRILHGYGRIITKGHTSRRSSLLCRLNIKSCLIVCVVNVRILRIV